MQKVSVIPHFYSKKGHEQAFSKHIKYSNFRIIKTTAAIPTKFCIVINTTKYSSQAVPECAPQMQSGGQLQSSKKWQTAIFGQFWRNFAWVHTGPLLKKFKVIKIQYGGWQPFWKTLNAISPQPFDRFWWNLVQWCILDPPTRLDAKNLKSENTKWATYRQ